jgi:hypothetical protein
MQTNKKTITFNCFSPPIMLATFCIEIILAAYSLLRYKLNIYTKLSVALLVALAIFQLCEYHVCGGWGVRASEWSRAGYVAISLLPPLGFHLLHVLAAKPNRRLVVAAYISMVGFVLYFTVVPHVFRGYACTGNYVIFQIGTKPAICYGLYYYGWILAGIVLGIRWANELKRKGQSRARNLSTQALVLGYLIFLVPTAVANSVKPDTRRGIPSIMCGFAVLFALILALYILPKMATKRDKRSS